MNEKPFSNHIPFPHLRKGSKIRPAIKNNTYHETFPRESMTEFTVLCCVCQTSFKYSSLQRPVRDMYCSECFCLKEKIMNMNFDQNDYIPGPYRLRVTFKMISKIHDGSCSDPGDLIIKTKIIKLHYPLLKIITKNDIKENNKISKNNPIVNLFKKPNKNCQGSEHCEYKTTFKIKKIKLCKSLKDEIFI